MTWWETVIEYGIAIVALFMMYSITFNHLTEINKTLLRIEAKLD